MARPKGRINDDDEEEEDCGCVAVEIVGFEYPSLRLRLPVPKRGGIKKGNKKLGVRM